MNMKLLLVTALMLHDNILIWVCQLSSFAMNNSILLQEDNWWGCISFSAEVSFSLMYMCIWLHSYFWQSLLYSTSMLSELAYRLWRHRLSVINLFLRIFFVLLRIFFVILSIPTLKSWLREYYDNVRKNILEWVTDFQFILFRSW